MKAASTPIKEYIIKKMAVNKVTDKLISEKTMDVVISHQFESAIKAMQTNSTVEISGFGKFLFNFKRAQKELTKYEKIREHYTSLLQNTSLSEEQRKDLEDKLAIANDGIKNLKPRVNEYISNL
jgi:nucleoid DNA-binding protein